MVISFFPLSLPSFKVFLCLSAYLSLWVCFFLSFIILFWSSVCLCVSLHITLFIAGLGTVWPCFRISINVLFQENYFDSFYESFLNIFFCKGEASESDDDTVETSEHSSPEHRYVCKLQHDFFKSGHFYSEKAFVVFIVKSRTRCRKH